ncbi:hypothetical protein HO133_007909 [Letharia lupina]|uniref:Uncharacterized protein n=1 Tax=Letharia lupina TaxID=560253 RepID=A0A8H6CR66_9LECA|nr:uncharacterized protein HO133_007909 [Letharia lupina]KAF6228179.1 hypothetical protein HO133_007909 [Letharia lupina]
MGQQFSRLPSGFQPGVDSWYGVICSQFHFIPDFREPDIQDYFLKQCVYSGSFIGLLLLLSWYYGQSSLKNRLDPVGAANEERNAAIKERDDAQRAWVEMGTKHERAMGTNLELRAELSTAFKDLPWLKHRNTELAEENSVQHNEIERLEGFKQDYDELLQHVSVYGMSAKRPEYYQQRSEQTQRQLEISNNLLEKSEKCVKALEEKLGTQREKGNKEKEWLRSQLKKNARSTAYWARYRPNALDTKPAWGVRCACTEPEIAYGLKDQNPRIVELEATVAARDLTIKRLRERRPVWNSGNNDAASTSNADHTSLPSTEVSKSDSITGSQTLTTTLVHTCEYEEQCKTLGKQVADDAETIRQLRKECQDLGEPASNKATADTVEFDATAELKGQLAAKDTEIKDLRAEKVVMSDEVGAKNETINGLRKEKVTGSEELAKNNQAIKDLREEKVTMGEELAAKDKEINDLREEKTTADKNATTAISDLRQEISDSRISLVEARKVSAECEHELGEQKTKISELEAAHRGLEDAVKRKDREINDLQKKNQEIAEQPAPGYAENLQRLTTANSDLDDLRREHCECKGHSESQKARISELEAAGRELRATIKVKDDRITELEGQINNAPSHDLIERHIQSQNDAISNKDRDYQALYDLYNKMLGQEALAEAKHNEDMQSLNTMQQSVTAKQLELQRLWDEYNNLRSHHTNCEGRTTDLTNQLRQGANTYTDLQTKYNTQATELDVVNQNARGLRSEVANLQQTNANLEQMNSSSESNFEKYRIEGENRARPSWQANFDREMSTQALKLEASEGQVFKLENQLQQAKNQASPLREMQIKAREDAVQLKEDALKLDKDAMVLDQDGSKADHEIKTLENKLAAANKDAGDARVRNRGIQSQLNKERKERADEKARHEKVLEKEREDSERRSDFLKLRLERENPLKGTVSNLQDEVARLSKELGEQQSRGNDG